MLDFEMISLYSRGLVHNFVLLLNDLLQARDTCEVTDEKENFGYSKVKTASFVYYPLDKIEQIFCERERMQSKLRRRSRVTKKGS